VITLRSLANNLYVSANCQGCSMIANRQVVSTWETFLVKDMGNGNVALQALMNNSWVSADCTGTCPLIANRPTPSLWETFQWVDQGNGNVSLKALDDSRFVCADNAGTSPLIANRATAQGWETFSVTVVPGGASAARISVKATPTVSNGLVNAGRPLIVGPNPAKDAARAVFNLLLPATVRLRVVDLAGDTALERALGALAAGTQSAELDLHSLPSGIYIVVLESKTLSAWSPLGTFKLAVAK
jgi:hypothetical protein